MKLSALPIERRRHRRSKISIDCMLAVNNGPPEQGRTRNIAPSGIAIVTGSKARQGDKVDIFFDSYGRHNGKVSRVFEDGFAVELPTSSLAVLALCAE